jgi:hypothetical protein
MVFGSDVTVFYTHPHQKVCIEGIDSHQINDVPLAHAAGVVTSSIGDVVIILPWGAKHGSGATIMCPAQMEYFGHRVHERSRIVNGNQCITTTNGVVIPINIINGLPRLPICPCTDHDRETLPTIHLAGTATPWDPRVLNNDLTSDDYWLQSNPDARNNNPNFDMYGDYTKRTAAAAEWSFNAWDSQTTLQSGEEMIEFDMSPVQVVDEPKGDSENKILIDDDPIEDVINNITEYSEKLKKHNRTIQLIQGIYDDELEDEPPNALTFDTYSCTQQLTNRMVFSVQTCHQTREAAKENDTRDIDSTPTEPPEEEVPPEPPPDPIRSLTPKTTPQNGENSEIFKLEDNILSHDNDEPTIKIVGRNKMF